MVDWLSAPSVVGTVVGRTADASASPAQHSHLCELQREPGGGKPLCRRDPQFSKLVFFQLAEFGALRRYLAIFIFFTPEKMPEDKRVLYLLRNDGCHLVLHIQGATREDERAIFWERNGVPFLLELPRKGTTAVARRALI